LLAKKFELVLQDLISFVVEEWWSRYVSEHVYEQKDIVPGPSCKATEISIRQANINVFPI
jgi:hypothetical protein